jgi:hypothetical protein
VIIKTMEKEAKTILENIAIGDRVEFKLSSVPESMYVRVAIHGMIESECLLIGFPKSAKELDLAKGAMLDCRLFQGGRIYDFQSNIIHIAKRPHQLVSIEIPRNFSQTDLRLWPRIPTLEYLNLAVKNETTGALKLYKGKMSNISLSGAGLDIPATLGNPGDRLALRFRVRSGNEESEIMMNATVRQIRDVGSKNPASRNSWFFHGVEFDLTSMKGNDKLNLQGFIYEQNRSLLK